MNILVTGTMDEGKTTLAMWLARKRHRCVVAFDQRGNISGYVVTDPEELEDAMNERCWENEAIVYRYDLEEKEPEEAFREMTDVLMRYGGYALVIDEAGELQTFNSIDKRLRKVVAQHIKRPPERSVTVIQTSHRLPEFHGKSKTIMHELYTFRTPNPRDLELVVDYAGDDSLGEIVRSLPKHHCVRIKFARQDNGRPQWELWDNPSLWFVAVSDAEPVEKPQTQLNNPPQPEVRQRKFMERVYGE